MTTCKTCKEQNPDVVMIKNTCYLCILKKWPPKTRRQYRIYENAVAIRLRLTTPLSDQKSALKIVHKIGLDNLLRVQAVIDGKIVLRQPGVTFYQRLIEKLDKKWKHTEDNRIRRDHI